MGGRKPKYENYLGIPWNKFIADEVLLKRTHDYEVDEGNFDMIDDLLAAFAVRKMSLSEQFEEFPKYKEMIRRNLDAAVTYCEEVYGIIVYKVPRREPIGSTWIQIVTIDPDYEDAEIRSLNAAAKRVIWTSAKLMNPKRYRGIAREQLVHLFRSLAILGNIAKECGQEVEKMDELRISLMSILDEKEIPDIMEELEWLRDRAKSAEMKAIQGSKYVEKLIDNQPPL